MWQKIAHMPLDKWSSCVTVQSAKTFPNKGNITVQLLAPHLQRLSQKDLILETSSCIHFSDKVATFRSTGHGGCSVAQEESADV